MNYFNQEVFMKRLSQDDPGLSALIEKESDRLDNTLNLIAAENHPPLSILEVMGSSLNIKTIEGYPGRRFHAGCSHVDEIETLAISRGKKLFKADHVNVQPHSGTSANLAVYFSVLELGDPVLAMALPHGGHLSHGHRASITSRCFNFFHYKVDPATGRIDYDGVAKMASEIKPKMVVAGASSYPRLIDYEKMAEIAQKAGAYFMVDMAHLAGLVAAGTIPSPVPHADFVTLTCYKTFMGGRGGVILCRKEYADGVDRSVFPGCQGTTPVNTLAAKALIFKLARTPEFVHIQENTVALARQLAQALGALGYRLVSGGTDNHQVLVDLKDHPVSGPQAEELLESVGIVVNRNVVPGDAGGRVGGIRLGCGALAARKMGKAEIERIAGLIHTTLTSKGDGKVLEDAARGVARLCRQFPIPEGL